MSEPNSRLCALAGFLAERAVRTLVLTGAGSQRVLRARETDLPRELETLSREGGAIEIPEFEATIHFVGADVRCVCTDPAVSIAIMKALADQVV